MSIAHQPREVGYQLRRKDADDPLTVSPKMPHCCVSTHSLDPRAAAVDDALAPYSTNFLGVLPAFTSIGPRRVVTADVRDGKSGLSAEAEGLELSYKRSAKRRGTLDLSVKTVTVRDLEEAAFSRLVAPGKIRSD